MNLRESYKLKRLTKYVVSSDTAKAGALPDCATPRRKDD